MIDRRQFLGGGLTLAAASVAYSRDGGSASRPQAGALPAPAGFALTVQPSRVFKRTPDQNRLQLEHWLFTLVLRSPQPRKPRLQQLVVRYGARGKVRRVTTYLAPDLEAMDLVPTVQAAPERPDYPVAALQVGEAMPRAMAIDQARCEIRWLDGDGLLREAALDLRIETYVQRTALLFPFRGHGMITQGGAWNDGHRNRSGMFAIDAIGLTELYAPMIGVGDTPQAAAGWGRTVLAPAAGEVVVARGDRPDQPVTGVSDPKYFVPEFPSGGDPGNHCVIDHGNGEFSLLAHLQQNSLQVGVGDRVRQGQALGKLGNSGDSNTPHVHHQLQAGPQWPSADALPHVYGNGPGGQHDRGAFFSAD